MTFPVDLTCAMTGASAGQLRSWRLTGVLAPEYGKDGYSFRDLIALRTVARLRKETSLQKIRKALIGLKELELTEHPSKYKLTTDGDSVYLLDEEGVTDLVKRRGQMEFHPLLDIFGAFTNRSGREVSNFLRPRDNLEVRAGRLGGWPTLTGTRIAYDSAAQLVADGSLTPEAVVKHYYPTATVQALRDAADFDAEVRSMKRGVA